jgi:signal peptidase I
MENRKLAKLTAGLALAAMTILVFYLYSPRLIIITSGSMRPTMFPGDVAVAVKVSPEDIRPGDVIVYTRVVPYTSAEVLTHRVVEVRHEGDYYIFKTKGDANPEPDPWDISPRDVSGKVLWVVPKLGWVLYWIRGNMVSVVLVTVGLGLVLLYVQPSREEDKGRKRVLAYLARAVLEGKMDNSTFEKLKLCIEYGHELDVELRSQPAVVSFLDFMRGQKGADVKYQEISCVTCPEKALQLLSADGRTFVYCKNCNDPRIRPS